MKLAIVLLPIYITLGLATKERRGFMAACDREGQRCVGRGAGQASSCCFGAGQCLCTGALEGSCSGGGAAGNGKIGVTIYVPGALDIPNTTLSFFDWYFREQEKLQSLIRRYESPDEYPFFPDAVRRPILRALHYPPILHANDVDVNPKIRAFYLDRFLPAVCPDFGHGDRGETQENYGSAATCDIACLQALSRRIHFGKFVAESKFRAETDRFTSLIRAADRQGIADAITNRAVELQILDRLRLKAATYGKDPGLKDGFESHVKIDVDAVAAMYEKYVIPLTKEVEVEYLMQRLEPSS